MLELRCRGHEWQVWRIGERQRRWPAWGIRVGAVEVMEEDWGHDLGPGNPALLRSSSIPLPVDQVLESLAVATNLQEPLHRPLRVAIHQLRRGRCGRGRCGSRRHQIAGDKGLDPGDMVHWVDTSEGVREDQPDGRRVDDPVDGVRPDIPGCQLPGGDVEGEVHCRQPDLLAGLVLGGRRATSVGTPGGPCSGTEQCRSREVQTR